MNKEWLIGRQSCCEQMNRRFHNGCSPESIEAKRSGGTRCPENVSDAFPRPEFQHATFAPRSAVSAGSDMAVSPHTPRSCQTLNETSGIVLITPCSLSPEDGDARAPLLLDSPCNSGREHESLLAHLERCRPKRSAGSSGKLR